MAVHILTQYHSQDCPRFDQEKNGGGIFGDETVTKASRRVRLQEDHFPASSTIFISLFKFGQLTFRKDDMKIVGVKDQEPEGAAI